MTSKPSLTNCPKAFAAVIFSGVGTDRHRQLACEDCHNPYSGGYCGGVPPLPIPNREVKPACADGTAMQCGRVGGRHFFEEPLSHNDLRAFFCVSHRSRRSHRYSLLLGDGIHSSGAKFMATECPLFTGAKAPFTLRDGTPSPWEGRLALSPNSSDIAYKRSGLRVRTARTGCEPTGRSAQNDKKIESKN